MCINQFILNGLIGAKGKIGMATYQYCWGKTHTSKFANLFVVIQTFRA